ncbi:unnamed protein product [Rangifer tarandus platyrhynchus]|uniref:Uncharacterized protein n=2 Tax=Rangifer tarandus platyrhynchus TaxID=3082113 RepID=A0ACB0EN33_RANTA|nr:unnamed protein product [Rangifer tarandus platyrhynchus]CAI9702026.1 unnamed protein product [Rangifer tarandus platyrhynchus]
MWTGGVFYLILCAARMLKSESGTSSDCVVPLVIVPGDSVGRRAWRKEAGSFPLAQSILRGVETSVHKLPYLVVLDFPPTPPEMLLCLPGGNEGRRTLSAAGQLDTKALATSFICHRVRTGEARRLHTALRRWVRFLCGKALSALHLASKKASPGRVTAAVQHPPHPRPTGQRLGPGELKKCLPPA